MTADAALVALVVLPAAVGAVLCLLAAFGPAPERPDPGSRAASAAVAVSLTTAATVLALAVVVAVQQPGVGATYLAGTTLQLDVGGLATLFAPTVAAMYPLGFTTTVAVEALASDLEVRFRPGHFAGVATVVTKLLTMAFPDIAVFGEKD